MNTDLHRMLAGDVHVSEHDLNLGRHNPHTRPVLPVLPLVCRCSPQTRLVVPLRRAMANPFPFSAGNAPASCTMWKSFFLASGIFACLVGVEMLLIDSAVVMGMGGGESVFRAPDWMPWTLLSVGAATILHFYNLPATSSQTSG